MSQNTLSLLRQAAELRAVGHTWDAIAPHVHRKPQTCQKRPTRFREQWTAIYREVQLRRFEETSNEAHSHRRSCVRALCHLSTRKLARGLRYHRPCLQ